MVTLDAWRRRQLSFEWLDLSYKILQDVVQIPTWDPGPLGQLSAALLRTGLEASYTTARRAYSAVFSSMGGTSLGAA